MNRMLKKSLALVMALVMVFSIAAVAAPVASNVQVTVLVNGKPLTFTDATPQLKDDRTYVPYRAVFEALGAEVAFDGATRTVTAQRDDTQVSFVLGTTQVTITENDETQTVATDAAPYIDPNTDRTMVPVRFAAQALGCMVGWDQETKTVNVIDVDALRAAYGDKFQLMERASKEMQEAMPKELSFSGKLNMELSVTDSGTTFPISITGTISGGMNEDAANMKAALSLDLTKLLDESSMTKEEYQQAVQLMAALKNVEINYIINMKTGMIYLNMPVLAQLEPSFQADAWYSLSLNEIYQQILGMDVDFATLMTQSQDMSIVDALLMTADMVKDAPDAYAQVVTMLSTCESILGDKAFTKNGNVYTSNFAFSQNGQSVGLKMTLTETNDKISAMTMDLTAAAEGMEISMKMAESAKNSTLSFSLSGDAFTGEPMEMKMELSMDYSELTDAVLTEPAAGSAVYDLMELLGGQIPELPTEEVPAA